jgi:hypothetical protein
MPLWAAITILAISTVGFMLVALALKRICWSSGERLVDWIANKPICNRDQQKYSIAQLIGLTTLVALGIVGIRAILPATDDAAPTPNFGPAAFIAIAVHATCRIWLLVCAAKIALPEPAKQATILRYSLFVALGLVLEIFVLIQVRFLSFDFESVVRTVAFNAGFFLTVLGALGMLRSVGYRLVRVR